RALAARRAHRLADDRGAVVARSELVAAAAELARRRVREHDTAFGVACQRGSAIDDLAHRLDGAARAEQVHPGPAARDPHVRARAGEAPRELERDRGQAWVNLLGTG